MLYLCNVGRSPQSSCDSPPLSARDLNRRSELPRLPQLCALTLDPDVVNVDMDAEDAALGDRPLRPDRESIRAPHLCCDGDEAEEGDEGEVGASAVLDRQFRFSTLYRTSTQTRLTLPTNHYSLDIRIHIQPQPRKLPLCPPTCHSLLTRATQIHFRLPQEPHQCVQFVAG